jgi:hypothetical protein
VELFLPNASSGPAGTLVGTDAGSSFHIDVPDRLLVLRITPVPEPGQGIGAVALVGLLIGRLSGRSTRRR